MQPEKVLGIVLAAVCASTPGVRAAPLPALRGRAAAAGGIALVSRDMPVTYHDKDAGDGYQEGSPLYKKQQARGPQEPPKAPDAPPDWAPEPAKLDTSEAVTRIKNSKDLTPNQKAWLLWGEGLHQEAEKNRFWYGLYYFFNFVLFNLLLAMIWVKCIGRQKAGYWSKEKERDPRGFTYPLWNLDHCCDHHSHVCLCTWCCFPLRLADTYSKEPHALITNFWAAVVIVSAITGLCYISAGWSELIFLCGTVYFRQHLRKVYSLPNGNFSTILGDCLTWCCCPFCAAAQEARQVEFIIPKDVTPESQPYVPPAGRAAYGSQKSFNGF